MDLREYTLIVGMASRLNYIYDIRKLDEPVQRRDSSLKFMTRCLKLAQTGDGTLTHHTCPPHTPEI
jgi:cell cycle arrest protein BUB3